MQTNKLKKIVGKRNKRIGRGPGSGKGFHTVGKGQKGQTARAGYSRNKLFTGGQNRIVKGLPKSRGYSKGKTASLGKKFTAVRLSQLISKNIFEIENASLASFSSEKRLKLVGDSSYEGMDLAKVVIKSGVPISKALKEKIVSGGGTVQE